MAESVLASMLKPCDTVVSLDPNATKSICSVSIETRSTLFNLNVLNCLLSIRESEQSLSYKVILRSFA